MKRLAVLLLLLALPAPAQQPQTQSAPIFPVNSKYVQGVGIGYWPKEITGTLNIDVQPGTAFCGGVIVHYDPAPGTVLTMTASTTNYIYLDTASSCAPAVKTTAFTSSDIPIATVIAGSSSISSIEDDRTMFLEPGSGSGGGNVSNSGAPTLGQYAVWVDANHIQGQTGIPYGDLTGAVPTWNQPTTSYAAGLAGGALGSAPYQSAANTTAFIGSPTTSGHAFFFGWQPSGSVIAPQAFDLGSYLAANITAASPLVATPTALGVDFSCPSCGSGSMTWPFGGAGIPNYNGASGWGTTYDSANTIPANFLSGLPGSPTTGQFWGFDGTNQGWQTPVNPVATVPISTYSGTAGLGYSTLYTPSAQGEYQLCGYLNVVTAGTAGTFNLGFNYTDNGVYHYINLTSNVSATTAGNNSAIIAEPNNQTGAPCIPFTADAGSTINWKLPAASVTGSPTIQYWLTLRKVDGAGSGGGSGGGFTAGGDLAGTSTSQEVTGILDNALPSLASGYLRWNGSAWEFSTPSGSGTVNAGTAGQIAYYTADGTAVGGEDQVPAAHGGTGVDSSAWTAVPVVSAGVWGNSVVTPTELSYLSGVTSAIQTQLDAKQAAAANLTSIGALADAAGWLHNDGAGGFSYSTPSAGSLAAGTTPITGGTSGYGLYDNGGTLGEKQFADAVYAGSVLTTSITLSCNLPYVSNSTGALTETLPAIPGSGNCLGNLTNENSGTTTLSSTATIYCVSGSAVTSTTTCPVGAYQKATWSTDGTSWYAFVTSASSGTVNTGTAGQIAYYTADGTSVGGEDQVPPGHGGTGSDSSGWTAVPIVIGGIWSQSSVTPTELSYVHGVTGAIQTQIDAKQAAYANLTNFGSLADGAGWLHNDGSGTFSYSTPSASDITTGTLGAARLPTALSASTSVNGTSIPSGVTLTRTVASGTVSLGTAALASGSCTLVTATATGANPSSPYFDTVQADFNADPTSLTGYGVSSTGAVLSIYKWVTTDTVNFKVCNSTGSSITPSAATLNWRVTR